MKNLHTPKILAASVLAALLVGCGDAETTIIEGDPIIIEDDHENEGSGDHSDGGFEIESMGRLAVTSLDSNSVSVFDIDHKSQLDSFDLPHEGTSIYASGDSRFAVLLARSFDTVGFLDGGLWQEDHVDHPHDYEEDPMMSNFELSGSKPTHVSTYEGQLAIFFDGDGDAGVPAAVQIVTDNDIVSETTSPATIDYTVNMHGVVKPRGEMVLASIRRDDSETTSHSKSLPDQVGVYHQHDGEMELEQVLELTCGDMHGSAQNHEFVAFGCGDSVLVAHQHDDEFEAHRIDNIEEIAGVRIGTLFGHEASEVFVGVASSHGSAPSALLIIDPEESEMEVIDWQAMEDASPVAYGFTYDAAHFVILDNQGYLTLLAAEEHDGHTHLEFESRLDISEEDITTMPDGASFTMTLSKNDNHVYIADPMAQHILQVDIESMSIEGDIEIDFVPKSMVWLGIAEEGEGLILFV